MMPRVVFAGRQLILKNFPGAQLRDGTINVTPDGAQLIIHAAFVAGLVPWEK
jgi:hypothetical protein